MNLMPFFMDFKSGGEVIRTTCKGWIRFREYFRNIIMKTKMVLDIEDEKDITSLRDNRIIITAKCPAT